MIAIGHTASSPTDARLLRDLRTLTRFIEVYCHGRHGQAATPQPVHLKSHDVQRILGRDIHLCADCTRLLCHALVKRSHCPMAPKPACKHCPNHCYAPQYRQQIRQVMRYSGQALLLRGRLDYLWHMLF